MQHELSQLRQEQRDLIRDKRIRNEMELEAVSNEKKTKKLKNATAEFVRYVVR